MPLVVIYQDKQGDEQVEHYDSMEEVMSRLEELKKEGVDASWDETRYYRKPKKSDSQ